MKSSEAIQKLVNRIRLRHFSLSTEQSYLGWLTRYMRWLDDHGELHATSEQRLEGFLSQLARQDVSASTQNQAFNALMFFYREVVGQKLGNIDALRAKKPVTIFA